MFSNIYVYTCTIQLALNLCTDLLYSPTQLITFSIDYKKGDMHATQKELLKFRVNQATIIAAVTIE